VHRHGALPRIAHRPTAPAEAAIAAARPAEGRHERDHLHPPNVDWRDAGGPLRDRFEVDLIIAIGVSNRSSPPACWTK
jgi:hypothetical protein